MIHIKRQPRLKVLIGALACLVSGGALFGAGYWLGERSLQSQLKTLKAEVANPSLSRPPGNQWGGANIPANASPEMKEFMQNRATLLQKMAELRQRNPGANGAPDPKLFAQFQQENAALVQRQRELSQIIAQQQAKNLISAPPPLQIPPNASPQLK